MRAWVFLLLVGTLACSETVDSPGAEINDSYYDYTDPELRLTGGVRMIPIQTAKGTFRVWTKQVGNNPTQKVLFLHGGPGTTHEYFECFDAYFPKAGIEYYFYDQLDASYSDQPGDPSLWTIEHYVEEVEQVRQALGLDSTNFYLLGHSWGGILGMEYAFKYPQHLKGLIVSNMMASIPAYDRYANEVLAPKLDPAALREIKALEAAGEYTSDRYARLVTENYYPKHVLRRPLDAWPEPVNRSFSHLNGAQYLAMQGPSEFGIVGDVELKGWDRSGDLAQLKMPVLTVGGTYDTMDPEYMAWMAEQLPNGKYLHCPEGSHMSMYDDQATYMAGVIDFIRTTSSQ